MSLFVVNYKEHLKNLNKCSFAALSTISHSSKLKTFLKKIMRKEEYKIKGVERKKFMRGGAKYLPPPRVSRGGEDRI